MALVSTGAGIMGPGFLPLHASRPLACLLAGMTRSLEDGDGECKDADEEGFWLRWFTRGDVTGRGLSCTLLLIQTDISVQGSSLSMGLDLAAPTHVLADFRAI